MAGRESDPNTDYADDAAMLFTPGIQLFFEGRNKFIANVDIYRPERGGTFWSAKGQMNVYF